jgi:hypothetical protein
MHSMASVDYHLNAYDPDFDLKTGTLPGGLYFTFGDQLQRARALFTKRTQEEIRYAFESIDWLLRKGSDWHLDEAIAAADHKPVFVNRVKALRCPVDRVDLSGQADFPGATWSEYFAALVLATVVEALYEHIDGAQHLPAGLSHDPAKLAPILNDLATEAIDAVSYAEGLSMRDKVMQQDRMERGRNRAKPFNDLKRKLLTIYCENYQNRSNRDAAKRIWENQLTEEDRATLTADDPVHRLEIWIGQEKKFGLFRTKCG